MWTDSYRLVTKLLEKVLEKLRLRSQRVKKQRDGMTVRRDEKGAFRSAHLTSPGKRRAGRRQSNVRECSHLRCQVQWCSHRPRYWPKPDPKEVGPVKEAKIPYI